MVLGALSKGLRLRIGSRELHLWFVRAGPTTRQVARLYRILSRDEVQRASAFRFEKDANSFILARGLLRVLVATYIGQVPEEVSFQYGPKGKPELRQADTTLLSLYFSLAHSSDCFAYAFTNSCQVGVDVEHVRRMCDAESIARQFFCKEECQELFDVDMEERTEAFFNCWTRKEAYLKAIGQGLSGSLNKFRVSLTPGSVARFMYFGDGRLISPWTLLHLVPFPGYIGAVAAASDNLVVDQRRFPSVSECLKYLGW